MPHIELPDLHLKYHRHGEGPPLVLLHGWPEWSGIWRRVVPALAREFEVITPDLRNFGDSRGAEARAIEHYVGDLAALADALGLERFGAVGHDVGAWIMNDYARAHPDRLAGLFYFNCPHFGIGKRFIEGGHVREIWYHAFHQLPLAVELVGASRDTCRAYFRHFLRHWSASDTAFDDVLEEWVDNFMKPGNLAGGFRWYACANQRRLAAMAGELPPEAKIRVPAYSLWGEKDTILPARWQETLTDVFTDIGLETAPDAGHFVHWEAPDLAADRIAGFFRGRFG
jgi:pimeloyl-ACP methyl ester carboxylesterase